MRCLCARGYLRAFLAEPGAGGAIADGEDVFVARGLQRRQYHELIDAIRLQAVEVLQKFRRFHAGGPHDQLGRNDLSSGEPHACRQDLGHARGRAHIHLELREQLARCSGQARRQRRQDAIGGLDQDQLHVLFGIDAIKTVGHQRARRVVQLGRELHAGGACTDDRDLELLRT